MAAFANSDRGRLLIGVRDNGSIAGISSYRAESILANLIIFKVLIMKASEKGFSYELNPDEPQNLNN